MKSYLEFLNEEMLGQPAASPKPKKPTVTKPDPKKKATMSKPGGAPQSNPATNPDMPAQDILTNPAHSFDDYSKAMAAAKKIAVTKSSPDDRVYILTYKFWQKEGVGKFLVAYNKSLLSQAPDWESKGYTIIAWVSFKDGVVIRTPDQKYVVDPSGGNEEPQTEEEKEVKK